MGWTAEMGGVGREITVRMARSSCTSILHFEVTQDSEDGYPLLKFCRESEVLMTAELLGKVHGSTY